MRFFEVEYISIESNNRWFVAGCPDDWDQDNLRKHIYIGGIGDDVSKIIEITEVNRPKDNIYTEFL